jgi:hypothetical protein
MTSRPTRLCKTTKAWTLLAQPAPIKRSVRAVLLLANGRRSEQELSMLLGADVSDLILDLWMQGCLQPATQDLFDDGWEETRESQPAHVPGAHHLAELRTSA